MEIEQLPIVSETLPIKFPDRSVRSRFIDAAEGNGKSTIQQKDIPTSSTVDPQAKSCSSGAEMKFIRLLFPYSSMFWPFQLFHPGSKKCRWI